MLTLCPKVGFAWKLLQRDVAPGDKATAAATYAASTTSRSATMTVVWPPNTPNKYTNAFVCGHARNQALVSSKWTAPNANAVASLPFRELDEPIGILTAPQLLDDPRRDDIG